MELLWLLGVCVALTCTIYPSYAQDPLRARPSYLISVPDGLHPGTPTPLAVTLLTDTPVRVTAEVAQANASLVRVEDTFPGGLTGILTIPPIPEISLRQRLNYTLLVTGYQGEKTLFSNSTALNINPRAFTTLVQTDKSSYRPGETVRMRVLSVQTDGKPQRDDVDIAVRDPEGNVIRRWDPVDSPLGIVSKQFRLSENPALGVWTIVATVDEKPTEKQFIVDHYEPPHFEVQVNTASEILIGNDVSGTVKAQFANGQPVQGTLSISVKVVSGLYHSGHPFTMNKSTEISGSTQFFFSKDDLPARHEYWSADPQSHGHPDDADESITMNITACVTESSTGFKSMKSVTVEVMWNTYHLEFYEYPPELKPSLHFYTKLKVSRYDRRPLTSEDRVASVMVEVTQRDSRPRGQDGNGVSVSPPVGMDSEGSFTTLTLPVPEDGVVHVKLLLQHQVEMLVIRAQFMSSEETLEIYSTHSSPSGSYLQIQPVSSLPVQIGETLQINVESTFQLSKVHYLVTSGGDVVTAGTVTTPSFSLTPTVDWSPEACVTVYCVLPSGEVLNAATRVPIHRDLQNSVSLSWSSETARPGDRVSLTVNVLKPGSLVGILVVGRADEGPEKDPDIREKRALQDVTGYVTEEIRIHHDGGTDGDPFSVFTASDLVVLTDADLHDTERSKELQTEREEKVGVARGGEGVGEWSWLMGQDSTETWLWLDTTVGDSTTTSFSVTVPESFTSWRAMAFVMSDNLGLGLTTSTQRLAVSKDLSLSVNVPAYITSGEQLVLEVNVTNHLDQDTEVIVVVHESQLYEFVLANPEDITMANARKFIVESMSVGSALFPIRPLGLGEMEIVVDAISADSSDEVVRTVTVKPQGIEQSYSESLFLELSPFQKNEPRNIHFSFPPDVMPGSQRAHVALVGDILGLSIGRLEPLVQMPLGCGEQNMIRFAPNVYILQYLEKSSEVNLELRNQTQAYMAEGYERELSFQRVDGSFSAFGDSDPAGSTWLTAFVLRTFLQARPYMPIDKSVLSRAMWWLVRQQGAQGEFTEAGRVIHTELRGGLEDGPVSLTAFVLMALMEDPTYAGMFSGNVSLATRYLESKVNVSSNYSLCLVAYALCLANNPVSHTALTELRKRADMKDGVMTWKASGAAVSDGWQPRSAEVEMASYVLLSLYKQGSVVEGIGLMKWLSKQRNHLGGFGSTQDTVVALEALTCYAAFSGAGAIDLTITMSSPASGSQSVFHINATNYLRVQREEINAEEDILIDVAKEGRGFALFQMNVFYHLESRDFREKRLSHIEAFYLDVKVHDDEADLDHMELSICTGLLENQMIQQTGMVIVDVSMLSGFTLAPDAVATGELVRKVEMSPGRVSLYLDSLTTSEVCISLPLIRVFKMADVQDAVVQVYDYYEPRRRAMRSYNSDIMHNMDSCGFCGSDCSRCRTGITISDPSSTHSINSATYSLGCLLAIIVDILLWL